MGFFDRNETCTGPIMWANRQKLNNNVIIDNAILIIYIYMI